MLVAGSAVAAISTEKLMFDPRCGVRDQGDRNRLHARTEALDLYVSEDRRHTRISNGVHLIREGAEPLAPG
jgi:hypothetical protein